MSVPAVEHASGHPVTLAPAGRPVAPGAAARVGGLSVVIPVYNSERSLPPLLERLAAVLPTVADRFEVLLVNDCSADGSWSVIESLDARYPWVSGFDLMRNFGQHNALLCGVRAARYDLVVTMDDDLQHPPEEIPALLAPLAAGADVVYGAPHVERHGLLRNAASHITKLALQGAMGVESASSVSAFRAFRTRLRDAFGSFQNSYVSLDVLLTWGTRRFTTVRVRHDERTIGVSTYTVTKLIRHALNMITGFSTLPLRLASLVGFGFTVFGMSVLAYALIRFTIGGTVKGFTFLASIIAIFSGAQLFALGIIGEYLARMHTRMQDRPTYVVRHATSAGGAAGAEGRGRA